MGQEPGLRPTPRYRRILHAATEIAAEHGHQHIGTEHLFLALLAAPDAVPAQVLAELVNPMVVTARVRAVLERY